MSLPYRIGLYVSYADITGGWEAQEAEQQSLANILRQYSEDFCKTEFTQTVLMEALNRRHEWPSWGRGIDNLPKETGHIVNVLMPLLGEKQMHGFKEVLVDIAISVAMAFQEERDSASLPKAGHKNGAGFLSLFKKRKPDNGLLDHVHISAAERQALRRVCDAMKFQPQR